ncbi:MAG: electron transfer flavoprotein subunit alpha/FixB family protein [Ignavibacteriaceae bacterium]
MAKKIIAVIEQREGLLKRSAFELISTAADLASKLNLDTQAVILGNEINGLDRLSAFGISQIVHYKNKELENYSSAYTDIIADHVNNSGAEYIILANTSLGKDLAPRIAARTGAGCIMDAIDININDGQVVITRPIYAGKALLDIKFNSEKKVLTIRPNVFKPEEKTGAEPANIETIAADSVDPKMRVTEIKKSDGKLDVAEADIIVSGGRGLKSPENFKMIEELAETLGAAVGASRAVVDAGWRPHSEQVGQTGKTVSPTLYIACGISGAIQHLAGMSSSKYIVAINKDKDAPIFNIADYGIAGDVFEIIPALTEEIKKIKS